MACCATDGSRSSPAAARGEGPQCLLQLLNHLQAPEAVDQLEALKASLNQAEQQVRVLAACHPTLPHCHALSLSDCLAHCLTARLSHYPTIPLSCCLTVLLPRYHHTDSVSLLLLSLPNYFTVALSHSSHLDCLIW